MAHVFRQEEEMYQMLVGNYEERHRELVLENTELRDCLLTMQRELSSLLKQTSELSTVQSQSQVHNVHVYITYACMK